MTAVSAALNRMTGKETSSQIESAPKVFVQSTADSPSPILSES
jgi:hypothetical protein